MVAVNVADAARGAAALNLMVINADQADGILSDLEKAKGVDGGTLVIAMFPSCRIAPKRRRPALPRTAMRCLQEAGDLPLRAAAG